MSGMMEPPPQVGDADYVRRSERPQHPHDAPDGAGETAAATEAVDKLVDALAKAEAKFDPALKDKLNPHFKTKYASLSSLQEATRPHLAAEGLVVVQLVRPHGNQVRLHTRLIHASGQWLQSIVPLFSIQKGPQVFGGELTYLKRYCYGAILNLSAEEDDDDGHAAQQEAESRDRRSSSTRPPARAAAQNGGAGQAFRSAGLPPKAQSSSGNGHAEPPHDPDTGELHDNWLAYVLDGLEAEKDGTAWKDLLQKSLAECDSVASLKAIQNARRVVLTLDKGKPELKMAIHAWIHAAHERLAAEIFPGDIELQPAGAP